MDILALSNLMVKITEDRDEMAFSDLFDYLAPKINTYFLQNGLANESAEELTQEVMSTIWAKSYKYDPSKSAVSTWVYTIARNKKIDFFRKNTKTNINEEDIIYQLEEEIYQFFEDKNNLKKKDRKKNQKLETLCKNFIYKHTGKKPLTNINIVHI